MSCELIFVGRSCFFTSANRCRHGRRTRLLVWCARERHGSWIIPPSAPFRPLRDVGTSQISRSLQYVRHPLCDTFTLRFTGVSLPHARRRARDRACRFALSSGNRQLARAMRGMSARESFQFFPTSSGFVSLCVVVHAGPIECQ